MKRRPLNPFLVKLLALGLLLQFSSCSASRRASESLARSKEASVGNWANLKLDGAPFLPRLKAKTAILIAPAEGLEVESVPTEEGFLAIRFGFKSGRATVGSAVPVTSDGYFLTARHCIEGPPSALFMFDNQRKAGFVKTDWRLVWKSDSIGALDLALIHAPIKVSAPLPFVGVSKVLENGGPVAATGWSGLFGGRPVASSSAGEILRISEQQGTAPEPLWRMIGHSAPLDHGDSGGPLVDERGRLIGINFAVGFSRLGALLGRGTLKSLKYQGLAIAPNPKWLNSVIEADRKSRR